MPTINRRTRAPRAPWPPEMEGFLKTGESEGTSLPVFDTAWWHRDVPRAWQAMRDTIMASWTSTTSKPWGWWAFEAGAEWKFPYHPYIPKNQAAWLRRHRR